MIKDITAIILTAGFSSRMKKFKLDLPYKNHTIIEEVLVQLSKTSIKDIVLVTGHYKKQIEALIIHHPIKVVHNDQYALGMTTSIQKGVKESSLNTKGYLICLGDLPFISTEEYNEVLIKAESLDSGKPFIVRPFYNNIPAHPVFFSGHYRNDILSLNEKEGAKALIKKNAKAVHKVILKTNNAIKDIDTPEDYKNFIL